MHFSASVIFTLLPAESSWPDRTHDGVKLLRMWIEKACALVLNITLGLSCTDWGHARGWTESLPVAWTIPAFKLKKKLTLVINCLTLITFSRKPKPHLTTFFHNQCIWIVCDACEKGHLWQQTHRELSTQLHILHSAPLSLSAFCSGFESCNVTVLVPSSLSSPSLPADNLSD